MTLWLWLYVYNYDYDYNKVELPGRRLSMMATEFYDYSLRPVIRSIHSIAIPKLLLTGGAPVPWPTCTMDHITQSSPPLTLYTVHCAVTMIIWTNCNCVQPMQQGTNCPILRPSLCLTSWSLRRWIRIWSSTFEWPCLWLRDPISWPRPLVSYFKLLLDKLT
jgi:hypothetical protein